MTYTTIPFTPKVTDVGGAAQAAQELTDAINKMASEGWQFKSLETLTIKMYPTGCNTSGNKGPFYNNIQMLLFFKL
jgi:hypothetical protein